MVVIRKLLRERQFISAPIKIICLRPLVLNEVIFVKMMPVVYA